MSNASTALKKPVARKSRPENEFLTIVHVDIAIRDGSEFANPF